MCEGRCPACIGGFEIEKWEFPKETKGRWVKALIIRKALKNALGFKGPTPLKIGRTGKEIIRRAWKIKGFNALIRAITS